MNFCPKAIVLNVKFNLSFQAIARQKFFISLSQKMVTQHSTVPWSQIIAFRNILEKVSQALNMPQGNVSRLERNSDMLLSTLQKYVEAVGGKLSLTIDLPNQPPIALTSLGDLIDHSPDHL